MCRDIPLVTILLPCKDQKEEFLRDAVESVLVQTSPRWKLLVIVEQDGPQNITRVVGAYHDPRMVRLVSTGNSFAAALNRGIECADTQFVAILLSDDRLDPRAIEVIERNVSKFPEVDFFHSARRYIDAEGNMRSNVMPARSSFDLNHFKTIGSPVKHLLCWRRAKGMAIGNMDEDLSDHGCDDFDFPWRMGEAGCTFRAIPECLYYYRIHHDAVRLTTALPAPEQAKILRKMFRKHGVHEPDVSRYIQHALDTYLIEDQTLKFRHDRRDHVRPSCYREATAGQLGDFRDHGYAQRHVFPHRVYVLPKGGPDGLKMARRMCGMGDPAGLREIVLYGLSPTIDEFPRGLFFDHDVQWHQQHFGRVGQIASANLVLDGERMYGMNYLSDVVHRISRQRKFKTRIENRFKGWRFLLLNAILNLARDRGAKQFYSPTARLVMRHTDPARQVKPPLFTRIYDATVRNRWDAEAVGDWWRIDIARNAPRIVPLSKQVELVESPKTICVLHDIERGYGHTVTDRRFAEAIDDPSRAALNKMLAIEQKLEVSATYHVVGTMFHEVRAQLEQKGHALGFHSYDHDVARWWSWRSLVNRLPIRSENHRPFGHRSQLSQCRRIDYRVKGYRPAQSKITRQFNDIRLQEHNFEWFASSAHSLGFETPRLENGIVKIPIAFDDYDMHRGRKDFRQWERSAMHAIETSDFIAFGLHDCYAQYWLPHYERLLDRIRALGQLKTLDEVAAQVTLCSARWV